jgi:hypothetical protein
MQTNLAEQARSFRDFWQYFGFYCVVEKVKDKPVTDDELADLVNEWMLQDRVLTPRELELMENMRRVDDAAVEALQVMLDMAPTIRGISTLITQAILQTRHTKNANQDH